MNVRLRPEYVVIELDDDAVLVRSPDQGVRARVDGMTAAELARVLGGLDGSRGAEDALRGAGNPAGLASLVRGLIARGIVEDGGPAPMTDDARLFSHLHDDPAACVRRLATACVAVRGEEGLAAAVVHALHEAGVAAGDRGEGDAAAAPDLLVACIDVDAEDEQLAVDDEARRLDVPWLRVAIAGGEGWVGPLFLPSGGPCPACLFQREEANWPDPPLTRAYRTSLARDARSLRAYGRLPAFVPLTAAWVAIEATKYLSRCTTPAVLGNVLRVDFMRAHAQLHRVLRVPRCARCAPTAHRPSIDGLLYARAS